MKEIVYDITLLNLSLAFIPVALVIFIYQAWCRELKVMALAVFRMLLQLVAIGYLLIYIFSSKSPVLITTILCIMLLAASWIAIRPVAKVVSNVYVKALVSILIGCLPTLALIVMGVVRLDPWYEPRYLIPIAGMIFANAMNRVSLAAERFHTEIQKDATYREARNAAYRASLLPLINTWFAVGLVFMPGMMTGQILAGVSPLVAVRYQIMVMCMLLGASGIASAVYLTLQKKTVTQT